MPSATLRVVFFPRGRFACPPPRWGPQSGRAGIPTLRVGTRTRKSPGVVAKVSHSEVLCMHVALEPCRGSVLLGPLAHRRGNAVPTGRAVVYDEPRGKLDTE